MSFGTKLLKALACLVWLALVVMLSSYSDEASLLRTLLLGLAASLIAIPLGVWINWLIGHSGWLGRLTTVATIVLLFFPLFLHVSLWDAAFGKLGWLTSTRGEVLKPIVSGWTAAAWIHGIAAAPQVAIIFWLGNSTGTQVHEEQALLDAGPWSVMLHIKLQRIVSLAILAMAWVIVGCSREIAVTDIYQIGTLAEQIYLGYSMGAIGSAAGAWSTAQLNIAKEFQLGPSLIPIGIFCWLFTIGFIQLTSAAKDDRAPRPNRRRTFNRSSVLSGTALLFLLLLIPFANVLYRSGYSVKPVNGHAVGGFDASQMFASLQRATTDFGDEFFWSTVIAAVTATSIILFTTTLAWLATRNRFVRLIFIALLATSLALPGPLIGSSIAALFSNLQSPFLIWVYDRTIFAPMIASTIFCWPLAGMLVWFLLSGTDRQADQNIRIDGGTNWICFWQLGIRQHAWALSGIWLLTFALSFGELSASQLLLPPGMDTLPRLMLGLLHAGVDEMTAAISILIAATILAISLAAYSLMAAKMMTADQN